MYSKILETHGGQNENTLRTPLGILLRLIFKNMCEEQMNKSPKPSKSSSSPHPHPWKGVNITLVYS
jgi:hypothetical protein